MKKFGLGLLLLVLLVFCGYLFLFPKTIVLTGQTFGTSYRIVMEHTSYLQSVRYERALSSLLATFNHQLSTYDSTSVLSQFNAQEDSRSFDCSNAPFLRDVMALSEELYRVTDHAFDPTVFPLIQLWGFYGHADYRRPSESEIQTVLSHVGFSLVSVESEMLVKRDPRVKLDFSANAKGVGVDMASDLLESFGITHYLVEIGGEIRVSASKWDGTPWTIGIESPRSSSELGASILERIPLSGQSIATSGYYRNYFVEDGKTYMHIVDPRTGYPVQGQLVSVSVIAPTCGYADGLATALFVLGVEKGLALVESIENVECLMVARHGNDDVFYRSSGFPKL